MASYTVKKGDTLSEIAAANNTTVANLVKINNITNPDYIVVGQVIQLSGSSTAKKNNTSKPTIKAFGIQSNTENTMYATWTWDKSNTKEYRMIWYYATGDGIWFVGNDSTVTIKQATYSPPANATKVKFKVKAVAKTRKVNGKDTAYWTGQWSTEKTYAFDLDTPAKMSVPSVSIDKYKLTAEIDTYDKHANHVFFQVVKDNKTLFNKGMAKVKTNHASWSCTVDAGHEYKVRCAGARSYKSGEWTKYDYGEFSEYSDNISTIPAASKGITELKTQSETTVIIKWSKVSNATGYDIQYTTKKDYFDSSNEVSSMSVESTVTHAEITGLESGNEYFFRVRAVNNQGESAWTEIKSVIVGKKPAVPTTWSSTTTGTVGEDVTLCWAHNSEDASNQNGVSIELNIGGTITTVNLFTVAGDNKVEVDKWYTYDFYDIKFDVENKLDLDGMIITVTLKEYNGVCIVPTNGYDEGVNIKWRVKTKGVLPEFSDWSIERVIDIYAPPTLQLNVTNSEGAALETIESFPFYVSGVAGPDTQKVIGYHISVTADEGYTTIDQIGNEQTISPGQEVYSNYFDISEDLLLELTASSLDLENNVSYTVKGTVSMDSGLTAEASTPFTVSWTDLEYEPNAEINFDQETLTASIRPYCGDDGEVNYEWVSNTIDTSSLCAITYGNGKFVAVGNKGAVSYSEDAINWTTISICEKNLNSITYGNGKFVAVGNDGVVYYSEDGIDWIYGHSDYSDLPTSFDIDSVVYGNGKFIAVGSSRSRIYYAEDDGYFNWKSVSSISSHQWSIAYGNDRFVSLGYTSYYSDDGVKWISLGNGLEYSSIVYGNGKFIAAGAFGNPSDNMSYSEDGINWTTVEIDVGIISITYGNGKFVAVGLGTSWYSEDGINWTPIDGSDSIRFSNSRTGKRISYGDEKFVMLVDSGYIYHMEYNIAIPSCTLSVYRREFDGTFKEIATNIDNASNTWVPDPHPALDYARYRIVAIDKATGAVSYCDLPGHPVGEKAVIIQWNEEWSYFDVTNEDEMEKPPWEGSMLKLPYNIDVSDKYNIDVSLVEYIGRKNPVSYYGTQIGETASWKVDIDKKDEETLYALRRLAIWMGDVYVREPSGSGYWAHIKVSFSQTHRELTIPVTLDITRVEGGI